MCLSTPSIPDPIPPPEYADYAEKRKKQKRPRPGEDSTILTSPLGAPGTAMTQQKTLLGQ